MIFTIKLVGHYREGELAELCKDIASSLNRITTVFVFLSALCNKISIMSTDYVDCLEMGAQPPPESLYWVAPFIIEYLYKNKSYLDENCMAYLQEETNMQLNEPTQ